MVDNLQHAVATDPNATFQPLLPVSYGEDGEVFPPEIFQGSESKSGMGRHGVQNTRIGPALDCQITSSLSSESSPRTLDLAKVL